MTVPYGALTDAQSLPISALSVDLTSADFSDDTGFMLRVGGAGNVTYRAVGSRRDVAESFAAGDLVPVVLSAVRMTGTTATGLVAYLWRELFEPPTAPVLSGVAGVEMADLSWTAPSDNGGAEIVRYEIRRDSGAWIDVGLVLEFTDADLTAGTAISYTVRAVNAEGLEGTASNAVSITPTAPPSP